MNLTRSLHQVLNKGLRQTSSVQVCLWFSLSLLVTVGYGLLTLKQVLSNQYIIHDDVRSHVFWMRRFLDSSLFPQDLISDYFQSVAPAGYFHLYRLVASWGIDPLLFNKVLPLFLALVTSAYCFGVCMAIFSVPAAGFIATVFLNQTMWLTPEITSGTPRAFFYPLLLAFLYYLLRRSLFPCLVSLVLQGLFYPHCLLISAGILILQLFRLENGRPRFVLERSNLLFCAAGLGTIVIMLLPYALQVSEYGPVATAAQAREIPIFQSTGRKPFFYANPIKFWFCAERSSIIPYEWCTHFPPLQVWVALLLPILLKFGGVFPLTKQVSDKIALLPQVLLSSLGVFFAAHILLFKLHLPSRYSKHSIRILAAIAAGIALIIILDAVFVWTRQPSKIPRKVRQLLTLGFVSLLTVLVFSFPSLVKFSDTGYKTANALELYEFFAQQPKDALIASFSEEANNIPTFSRRSVLFSSETAVPYHLGFYRQIEQRAVDLMQAQYSQDLAVMQDLIQKYGVDFVLLDSRAFTPEYIEQDSWMRGIEPAATAAIAKLKQETVPALSKVVDSCSVLQTKGRNNNDLIVLSADCLLSTEQVKDVLN